MEQKQSATTSNSTIVPVSVTDLDIAFGGDINKLMPKYEDIPKEFHMCSSNKWNQLFNQWFFQGLPKGTDFIPKEGIDATLALKHIMAIMRSYQPKHEHMEAAVSYLMSLWFKDVVLGAKK